jgi:hypothetical protein
MKSVPNPITNRNISGAAYAAEQAAEGRSLVCVLLKNDITVQVEDGLIVSFEAGDLETTCGAANFLREYYGAALLEDDGTLHYWKAASIAPGFADPNKPQYSTPTRGGVAGSLRFGA